MISKTIIIPAFNEEKNIAATIRQVVGGNPFSQTLVIDDGSLDATFEISLSTGASSIRIPHHIGNGAAIKTGIRAARGDILSDRKTNPRLLVFTTLFPSPVPEWPFRCVRS